MKNGLGLELCYEKGTFKNEAGVEIVYNRYYVNIQNQVTGEYEKAYLQAKDTSKYLLGSVVKVLEKK